MIGVYHVTDAFMDSTHGGFGFGPVVPSFPNDYVLVATVNTETIGEAFQLTNHIDQEWWKNKEVTKVIPKGTRSSAVWDVFVSSDGNAYLCDHVGWKRL